LIIQHEHEHRPSSRHMPCRRARRSIGVDPADIGVATSRPRPCRSDPIQPSPGLMPFVAQDEAFNRPVLDVEALADEQGPPPWRACIVGTAALRVVLLHWPAGYQTIPHVHPAAEEVFRVVKGRAVFAIGEAPEREVGPGEFVLAKRGELHAIRVPDGGPLLLLAAVAPNEDRPDETIEPA
jgi:mannose-6-phosphate isomerase-like protein (cupin superfamily)